MIKKVLSVVFVIIMCGLFVASSAEELSPNAFVLRRRATDNVLIRNNPKDTDYIYWKLVDNDPPCCAELFLTGEKYGKWLKCICLYLPDQPEGWIHSGFVVYDKPEECGKMATVTKTCYAYESIGGREAQKFCVNDYIKILYQSDEWCTTIYGMVSKDSLKIDEKRNADNRSQFVREIYRKWNDWIKRDHVFNIIDTW